MNRSDIKAPTEALIEISLWCSENLSHDRMRVKVSLDLYLGDFNRDAIAKRLSGEGKWCHLEAIEEARNSRPPGSLKGGVFKAMLVDLTKRDRRLMRMMWPKSDGLRWNRGTLKTVISALGTKLARGAKSRGAKPDPKRDFALEMIGRTAPSDSLKALPATCDTPVTEKRQKLSQTTDGQSQTPDGQSQRRGRPPSSSSSSSSSSLLSPEGREERKDTVCVGDPKPGDQAALIEGMETPAKRPTKAEERAEIIEEIYAYYQKWQPHWARALNKPTPKKMPLTKGKAAAIGQFLIQGYKADALTAAIDHVIHSSFHMGQNGYPTPRLKVDDVFKDNGKINTVEVLVDLTAPDKNMDQKIGMVISQRQEWLRKQEGESE